MLGDTESLSSINLMLATDGALLLHVTSDFGTGTGVLYRLTAGATRWQTLGPVPEPDEIYGAGTLWAGFDPQGRIYTAAYP